MRLASTPLVGLRALAGFITVKCILAMIPIPVGRGGDDIWLRTSISLTQSQIDGLAFWGRWDDDLELYVNGVLAVEFEGWTKAYRYFGMSPEAKATLTPGNNVLAVHVHNDGGGKYFDMGLVEDSPMAQLPASGYTNHTSLDFVSEYAADMMSQYGIPAGTIAISRKWHYNQAWEVMLSRGIGYMDKAFNEPVPNDAVMRLASVDKPPAFYALRKMMIGETRRFTNLSNDPDVYVCDMMKNLSNPSAVLNPATGASLRCDDEVFPILDHYGVVDSADVAGLNLEDIKIVDILHYQGYLKTRPGLHDDNAANLYYQHLGISPSQGSPSQLMRWYFTHPSDRFGSTDGESNFIPGAGSPKARYNSDDAAVVRFLVDKLSPGGLLDYLNNYVLSGFPYKDIFIAESDLANRAKYADGSPREPWYLNFTENTTTSIALEDALALTASSEAMVAFKHLEGRGGNYGGMRGTQSALLMFGIDSDDCDKNEEVLIELSWIVSGERFPFGFSKYSEGARLPNADGHLIEKLKELPLDSWNTTGTALPDLSQDHDNIVSNCSFDIPSATNWRLLNNQGGSGYAHYNGDNVRIDITAEGDIFGSVQLVSSVNISAGDYELSFKIRADEERTVNVNLGHEGGNWESYYNSDSDPSLSGPLQIGKEWRTYTLKLEDIPQDHNARIDFNMGDSGTSSVYVDEVYLAPRSF